MCVCVCARAYVCVYNGEGSFVLDLGDGQVADQDHNRCGETPYI
jgi:hypothetical protein